MNEDSDLFKEYCIGDLTNYKTNQIALRWRTKKEVISGKGEFICGNKSCTDTEDLKSWEVNFKYVENGNRNNVLVKLRLCKECSVKLNYHKNKQKSHKKKDSKSNAEHEKQRQSNKITDCESSEKSKKLNEPDNIDLNKVDDGSALWNNVVVHNIQLDINSRIEAYLSDIL